MTDTDATLDTKLSAIDRALAAAKARKAAKADPPADYTSEQPAAPKAKKETQKDFAAEQKRAALKQARDAERDARRAAKAANVKGPVHMKKVEKAASKLPALNQNAQVLFTDITSNLPREQVTAIALHLQHFNRLKATERALDQRVEAGRQVRIVSGDPRFIGQVGTVDRAQRIRCYVAVPGVKKPVYLFTSDVEVIQDAQNAPVAATG